MKENKEAANDTRKIPIRFIWIPGIKPVIVPTRIPKSKKIMTSINMFIESFNN